jgi:chemotaxis protein MotB
MEDSTMDGRFTRGRTAALAAILAGMAALGGCANDKADELSQLRAENQELRDQEAQLRAALNESDNRVGALQDERSRLQSENDRLRGEMASAPRGGSATGFEGISGTTTYTRGSDIVVDVAGDVLFASGSVTLKSDARRTLDRIASEINGRYSTAQIRIAGHTDSDPIRKSQWKTNERLSAERALAVEEYLATKGVGKDRMHIAGFGAAKPKGTKQASRRVEIVILGSAS